MRKAGVGRGLDTYSDIIPGWEEFVAACSRPLPTTLRVNTLRTAPFLLSERLARKGFSLIPVEWTDDLFTADDSGVSRTIEHWLGMFYIQEVVQTFPVNVLDPKSGETILDMCAAPGGKCTHIAALMDNCGTLVANEPLGRRQSALLSNLNRLGVMNATVTSYRGESFPIQMGFDRVLLDAPCSAEGTLRKERSLLDGATEATIARLTRLQRRLILRAYDLLVPGGILVYSTCTFAPEENEGTVAYLLGERDAILEPTKLAVPSSQGIKRWAGEKYPDAVTGCVRIYPHQLDSGGGFIARIRRSS